MNGPSARAMKRGVPPTARNARTGELTPPGMTLCARSKSAAFVLLARSTSGALLRLSVDTAWSPFRLAEGVSIGRRQCAFLARDGLAFFPRRESPEKAVGDHVAHAGSKTRVQALVEKGQGLADC